MEGAIIFGADVTHPSPEQTTIPSVAAVSIISFYTVKVNVNNNYKLK